MPWLAFGRCPVLRSSAQRKGTTQGHHDDCCPQQHGSSPAAHEPLLRLSGKPTTSHPDPSVGRPHSEWELALAFFAPARKVRVGLSKSLFAWLNTNFPSRRCGDPTVVWGKHHKAMNSPVSSATGMVVYRRRIVACFVFRREISRKAVWDFFDSIESIYRRHRWKRPLRHSGCLSTS